MTTLDPPGCHDETTRLTELPHGVLQSPMPYPSYGFEFSHGIHGHLKLRLHAKGEDMWIKDRVDLYVRFIGRNATSWDTFEWQEDSQWTFVTGWKKDVAMSTDSDEGVETKTLDVN